MLAAAGTGLGKAGPLTAAKAPSLPIQEGKP